MKQIHKLTKEKKNNEAVFLGCGPSINDLSAEAWQKINNLDIWASNNWFIHDVVPDFYHLEVKMHRNGEFAKRMTTRLIAAMTDAMSLLQTQYKSAVWLALRLY